jgi:hypothetical protein
VWAVLALVNGLVGGVTYLLQPFVLPLLVTLPALASAPSHDGGWPSRWVAAALVLVPLCGILGYILAVRVASQLS